MKLVMTGYSGEKCNDDAKRHDFPCREKKPSAESFFKKELY